jgi:hypothetical protein
MTKVASRKTYRYQEDYILEQKWVNEEKQKDRKNKIKKCFDKANL